MTKRKKLEIITGLASVVTIFIWYDWKLLIILFLYGFHLNLMQNNKLK